MITLKELGRVRRMFYRDGLSLSEISRKTGFCRNTIKRWLNAAEGVEPDYRRKRLDTKIAPYAAQLIKALETDAHRPKRDRRTALKLFGEIKEAGFTGDYSRVTAFVRRGRSEGGTAAVTAYVPLRFERGEAFRFDGSEEHLVMGGVWRKIRASPSNSAPAAPSCCRPLPRKVTKCCLTRTRAPSPHGGAFLGAASTTT